jgi:hypothetical protein
MTERGTWTQADTDAIRYYGDDRRMPSATPLAGGPAYDEGEPAPTADAVLFFTILILGTLIVFGALAIATYFALNRQIRWA